MNDVGTCAGTVKEYPETKKIETINMDLYVRHTTLKTFLSTAVIRE